VPKGYTRPETPEELWGRFWSKVDAEGDCWTWTASIGSHHYGQFNPGLTPAGKPTMIVAHRMAWKLLVGDIPAGMTLDHLCRNRRCVNPDHLEVVTRGENIRRGYAPSMVTHRSEVCRRGHNDWSPRREATGSRRCRTCNRMKERAWRAAHPRKK
jgi:hypothetical protein